VHWRGAWRPTAVDIVLDSPQVTLHSPGKGSRVVKRAPAAADLFGKGEGYYLDFPGNPLRPRCTYDRDGKRFALGKPSIAYAHYRHQAGKPQRSEGSEPTRAPVLVFLLLQQFQRQA
jgi:hypothetical protein